MFAIISVSLSCSLNLCFKFVLSLHNVWHWLFFVCFYLESFLHGTGIYVYTCVHTVQMCIPFLLPSFLEKFMTPDAQTSSLHFSSKISQTQKFVDTQKNKHPHSKQQTHFIQACAIGVLLLSSLPLRLVRALPFASMGESSGLQ